MNADEQRTGYVIMRDVGRGIGPDYLHSDYTGLQFTHPNFNQGVLFVATRSVCEEIARAIGNCSVVEEP
jgi:hypothetical protein